MKFPIPFACLLLAFPIIGLAQEPNPFVKKSAEKPAEAPAGPSFVGILEHILVPPELIDGWMTEHGFPKDATELRAAVQTWVEDGKATLDHTSVGVGVAGRKSANDTILEQIYPTEYMTSGAGVWPLPTAFETRNLGYEFGMGFIEMGGEHYLTAQGEFDEMLGSKSWHPLSEKTRHPGDVFLPVMRAARLSSPVQRGGDPFAESESAAGPITMIAARKPALLLRLDPLPAERADGAPTRLVFFRGESESKPEEPFQLPADYQVSVATKKVAHSTYSSWLQNKSAIEAASASWDFARALRLENKAQLVEAADGVGRRSSLWIENIVKEIYPTEYEPINRTTVLERWESSHTKREKGVNTAGTGTFATVETASVPGLAGASVPTAFETRNTGLTVWIDFQTDSGGVMAKFDLDRVQLVGESIYRRVDVNGEWIPDIKMPLFASSGCQTTIRPVLGKWMLLCCGSEYTAPGKIDRENCLLTFIKVE